MSEEGPKHVHLVLGPGGVQTFAFFGAIEELTKAGFTFASISGCSAGSFVGALIAAGLDPKELETYFLNLDLRRFAGKGSLLGQLRILLGWPFAAYSGSGMPGVLTELLPHDPKINELKIPFATVGIDLVTNRFVFYGGSSHADMRVSEVISISTAAPFMFPPALDEGRIVVDAAVATACPVWLAEIHGNSHPIVALTCSGDRSADRPGGVGAYLERIIEASVVSGDEMILAMLPRVTRIAIDCHGVRSVDFKVSKESRRKLYESGREAVVRSAALLDERGRKFVEEGKNQKGNGSESGGPARKLPEGFDATNIIYNFYQREVTMSTHNIQVGGDAIINIDATLNNVQQSIEKSDNLPKEQKDQFSGLVAEMKAGIEAIKKDHADEAALITQRLQEVVNGATKPPEQRKQSLLQLSGKGLIEAAATVGAIIPGLLKTAEMIAKFVAGI